MAGRGQDYDARFARLAAEGHYLHGEADLADLLLGGPPGRVLDAGCGTGRVTVELSRRGYVTLGVDVDPAMLDEARGKAPGLRWAAADLAAGPVPGGPFDLVLAAGNVLVFLHPGTAGTVVRHLATVVAPGGCLVSGFQLGRGLDLDHYDGSLDGTGLVPDDRWATWDRQPFVGGDYAVSVHRRPPAP